MSSPLSAEKQLITAHLYKHGTIYLQCGRYRIHPINVIQKVKTKKRTKTRDLFIGFAISCLQSIGYGRYDSWNDSSRQQDEKSLNYIRKIIAEYKMTRKLFTKYVFTTFN